MTGFIQGELAGLVTKDKDALERHLIASIQPDLIFESGLTREYLKEQVGQQSPLKGEVTEGTVIIRRGQVVSSVEYKQLESLRRAFRGEDAMENALPWLYIGYLLLVVVAVSVLLTFLWLLRKDILLDSRKITLLFLMIDDRHAPEQIDIVITIAVLIVWNLNSCRFVIAAASYKGLCTPGISSVRTEFYTRALIINRTRRIFTSFAIAQHKPTVFQLQNTRIYIVIRSIISHKDRFIAPCSALVS